MRILAHGDDASAKPAARGDAPMQQRPGGARDALARSLAAVAGVRVFYAGGGRQSMRAVSLFAGVGGVDGELMPLAVGVRLGVPAPHAPS